MKDDELQNLIKDWEDVYKRSQLSFWILLALSKERMFAPQINEAIERLANSNFKLQDQSLYRALRRFKSMGLVDSYKERSPLSGADRVYYELNENGKRALALFAKRNISPYYKVETMNHIKRITKEGEL